MKRAGLLLVMAIAFGCKTVAPTEVLVTIDAEPDVRATSMPANLRVNIWGRGQNGSFEGSPDTEMGSRWPWTVALVPAAGDANRVFRVEATALTSEGAVVSQTRIVGSYLPHQIQHVYLLLQDSCIGVTCEQLDTSCSEGRCQPIPEMPRTFHPEAGLPDASPPLGGCVPGSLEACDHADNDCDRRVDEGFDFLTDAAHCGGCDTSCSTDVHWSGICQAGQCACESGWFDCDGDPTNGCETQKRDAMSCGQCGHRCGGATPVCRVSGGSAECVAGCGPGETSCPGSCADLTSDPQHCGSCDNACSAPACQTAVCRSGACDTSPTPGSACEADGDSCTIDQCNALGECVAGPNTCDAGVMHVDGGVDAGHDAGVDAGTRDAGPTSYACTDGTTCGSPCCQTTSITACCGGAENVCAWGSLFGCYTSGSGTDPCHGSCAGEVCCYQGGPLHCCPSGQVCDSSGSGCTSPR